MKVISLTNSTVTIEHPDGFIHEVLLTSKLCLNDGVKTYRSIKAMLKDKGFIPKSKPKKISNSNSKLV